MNVGEVLAAAYRRARLLPWQAFPANAPDVDKLEREAWIGELNDLHKSMHALQSDVSRAAGLALRFLAASDAERATYDKGFYFHHDPALESELVLAAKEAGFKVAPKVHADARRRIEARLARERNTDPVVPQAWAVKLLSELLALTKKAAPGPGSARARAVPPAAKLSTPARDKVAEKLTKVLEVAQAKTDRMWEARRRLAPGSSRAKVTTANARWSTAAEARDRARANLDAHLSGQPNARPSTTPGFLGSAGFGNPPAPPAAAAPSWPDTFPGAVVARADRMFKPSPVAADALQLAEKRVEAVTTLGLDRMRLLDILPVLKATSADQRPLVAFVLANRRPDLLGEVDEVMREEFGAPDSWLEKARPKRLTAAGKARAKKAAKAAKAQAKKRESMVARAKGEALCALRVKERNARSDLTRAERQVITLTRQHTAALVKLQKAQRSCKHGCKRSKRALCMARPRVRELAQRLAAAMSSVAAALQRHQDAARPRRPPQR